jgi:hypothetical protein
MPSLFLSGLGVVLAHHLPYRFGAGLNRQGLIRGKQGHVFGESWVLRRFAPPFDPSSLEHQFDASVEGWIRHDIFPKLRLTRREARWTARVALLLAVIDAFFGYPIAFGVTYCLLFVGEFALFWIILATAWTLYEVSRMPAKLQKHLIDTPGLRLGHLDTSSVTRMGSIFIETIAYFLIVFGLLMMARLPAYRMAPWSRLEFAGIPWAAFLAATGLAFILWYWLYCYTALKSLIRAVKKDRLEELEEVRQRLTRRAVSDGVSSIVMTTEEHNELREKQKKLADDFEKERRAIEAFPEQPWQVSASWRAWLALAVIMLPPVLSNLFGTWSDVLMRTMRSLLGAV